MFNQENTQYDYPIKPMSIKYVLDIIENLQHKEDVSPDEIYFLENYEIYLVASIVGQLGDRHANRLGKILVATTD